MNKFDESIETIFNEEVMDNFDKTYMKELKSKKKVSKKVKKKKKVINEVNDWSGEYVEPDEDAMISDKDYEDQLGRNKESYVEPDEEPDEDYVRQSYPHTKEDLISELNNLNLDENSDLSDDLKIKIRQLFLNE